MPQPPLDPPVANGAPVSAALTGYDEEHLVTYLRLLDADDEGADWWEVAQISMRHASRCGLGGLGKATSLGPNG
jgi:hypothetical protein